MHQPFELPAELSIYTASDTHRLLLAWLGEQAGGGAGRLQLMAHGVDEIDGAGLQLLGSLANSAAALGIPLQLVSPSQTFLDTCMELGCSDWFQTADQVIQEEAA